MKLFVRLLGLIGLVSIVSANAAEVVQPAKDNAIGNGVGALSGLMVGGAAGGPLGGVVGAGLGWLLGAKTQEASGLSQTAYEIKDDLGELRQVRSPNQQFAVGEQVDYRAGRILPKKHGVQTSVE